MASRVLVIGPVFTQQEVGGLQLAIKDVAGQLAALGWSVEVCINEENGTEASGGLQSNTTRSRLSALSRWRGLFRLWHRLPAAWRRAIYTPFKPRDYFQRASDNLHAMDRRLATLRATDIVLYFVDESAPGSTDLVLSRCDTPVIVSLGGLAEEFQARWWHLVRLLCRLRFGGDLHPSLFRPARPAQVRLAVFASQGWRAQALRAGLPPGRAEIIYFGVDCAPGVRQRDGTGTKILWLGRLVPSKGLHLLLEALTEIRAEIGEVSVTAIAGQGQSEYRQGIEETIARHGLADVVTLAPPMPRESLATLYATHDLLFFYSQYTDPVALAMMEAFAAGLPVMASRPGAYAALVKDEDTCLCFDPDDTHSIATTAIRLLRDCGLRDRLARNARTLIANDFSLDAMGRRYDELLRDRLCGEGP